MVKQNLFHFEQLAIINLPNFINFFTYSLKSSNESKVWLTLLRDSQKGDRGELEWLLKELIEISNVLASSILTLKGKK